MRVTERILALDATMQRRSLAPGRAIATPLAALCEAAFSGPTAEPRMVLLADLVERFADDYPDNIFCDLDAVVGCLARGSLEEAASFAATVADLSYRYGRNTTLRFRYLHDFLYGLDWCRWAAKEPGTRSEVAPFSAAFLDYLGRRGRELAQLIAADDAKYPALPPGAYRNPFSFDRSPESEARLLLTLARTGPMPFDAWSLSGAFRLSNFVERRLALAAASAGREAT